jgi:hypothetical protein
VDNKYIHGGALFALLVNELRIVIFAGNTMKATYFTFSIILNLALLAALFFCTSV